jgi:hypothetical protein
MADSLPVALYLICHIRRGRFAAATSVRWDIIGPIHLQQASELASRQLGNIATGQVRASRQLAARGWSSGCVGCSCDESINQSKSGKRTPRGDPASRMASTWDESYRVEVSASMFRATMHELGSLVRITWRACRTCMHAYVSADVCMYERVGPSS